MEISTDRESNIFESMGDAIQVNFMSLVNNKDIRSEKIGDEEYIVLPSKTMPPNIVMNRLMYPESQTNEKIMTLHNAPAPIDHPKIEGQYVDARSTEAALNFGAGINKVVGKDEATGSWIVEKWVNKEILESTSRGKRLKSAIDSNSPIHTSTGVYLNKVINSSGENEYGEYDAKVEIIEFNHDAILPDSIGANTPEKGTGIFVNSENEAEQTEFEVVFCNLSTGDDFGKSSNSVREAISDALKDKYGSQSKYVYVIDFNEDSVIYEISTNDAYSMYAEGYEFTLSGVELDGNQVATKVKTVFEFNSSKSGDMKSGLLNKLVNLFTGNKETKNQPEEDTMSLIDDQLKELGVNFDDSETEAEKLGLLTKEVALSAAKAVKLPETITLDQVNEAVTSALAANDAKKADEAKQALVEQVIANTEYTEADKEMLTNTDERLLKGFLPKPKAHGLPMGQQFVNSDDQSDHELDLNSLAEGE